MAENKKGFVLYADQQSIFDKLTDSEAGALIKHIFNYVNDKNPIASDRITDISFEPIKLQLKRDLKKWEEIKLKRSNAGKLSAEKRQQTSTKSTHVESVQQTSTKSTVIVNVNDKVNVNDTVINTIIKAKEMPAAEFEKIIEDNEDDYNWIEQISKRFDFADAYEANQQINYAYRKFIRDNFFAKGLQIYYNDAKHVRNSAVSWYEAIKKRQASEAKRKQVY